jgi:Tfp pilus assembly protein PilP
LKRNSTIAVVLLLVFFAATAFAVEPKTWPQGKAKKEEKKIDLGDFSYKSEGTRDPFEPILLLKAKSGREAKIGKDKKISADAIGYELEELKLVGILKSDKGMMAMMEDTQGKGIFFRKGDYLNQNMWVVDVSKTNVVLGYKLKGEIKKVVIDIPVKK